MAPLEPLNRSADYRSRAKECRELARTAPDYESAKGLLLSADRWERLAMLPPPPPTKHQN
jgi:hypothetical protein